MPKKISELTEKTIEATDHLMVVAEGAAGNKKILASDFLPITETVTKTVAADGMPAGVQDFDDFDTAMKWACSQIVQGTILTLSLEDGTHYVGDYSEYSSVNNRYYVVCNGSQVVVQSTSGIQANCIITMPADAPDTTTNVMGSTYGFLTVRNLTFDATYSGDQYPNRRRFLYNQYNGSGYLYSVLVKNSLAAIQSRHSSYVFTYQLTVNNCQVGAFSERDSFVYLSFSEINNCTQEGLRAGESSRLSIYFTTLSGNTADTNIPINEIQTDGSYITDGTEELVPYPITESITKTVAADGDPAGVMDFDSFHEAMVWVSAQTTASGAEVTLSLEDGVHKANPTYNYGYLVESVSLYVIGASSDESLCTITIDAACITASFLYVFNTRVSTYLFCRYVSFDPDLDGYAGAGTTSFAYNNSNCTAVIRNAIITNTYRAYRGVEGAYSYVADISVVDSVYFIRVDTGTDCTIKNITTTNLSQDVVTFSGTDSNCIAINVDSSGANGLASIPANVRQLNGNLLSTADTPLTQEGAVGTTAGRPTSVQIGNSYFDTTLGYRIDWDGTNWVDSTGTTV